MKFLVILELIVAAAIAAPVVPLDKAAPCLHDVLPVAYAAGPAPAIAYPAPAPIAYAAPAPAVVAVAPPPAVFQTRVHYAETPVVVGHTSQILKPALGGTHPFAFGTLDSLDAQIVRKEKVLAPVRTESQITPQVTVQHPTKVNVQKFAVDVPVPSPYPQPVPVAVPAPYEIHQVHTPAVQQVFPVAHSLHYVNGVPCPDAKTHITY